MPPTGDLILGVKIVQAPATILQEWEDGLKGANDRVLQELQFTAPDAAAYQANIAQPASDVFTDPTNPVLNPAAVFKSGNTQAEANQKHRAKLGGSFEEWNKSITDVFAKNPISGTSQFEDRVSQSVGAFEQGWVQRVGPITGFNRGLVGEGMLSKLSSFIRGPGFNSVLSSKLEGVDTLLAAASAILATNPSALLAAISNQIMRTFTSIFNTQETGGDVAAAIVAANVILAPIATAFQVGVLTVTWENPAGLLRLRATSV